MTRTPAKIGKAEGAPPFAITRHPIFKGNEFPLAEMQFIPKPIDAPETGLRIRHLTHAMTLIGGAA